MSDGYNGWTNWETWNLSNWVQSDEDSYNFWREQAAELDVQTLADALQEDFDSYLDDMSAGWHKDALGQALSRVNWEEVAESLKE